MVTSPDADLPAVERQYQRVEGLLNDPSRGRDLKTTANDVLNLIREDYRAVTAPDAQLDHLVEYISREADKYHADNPGELGYESGRPRDQPLCTCRSQACPLKQGQLPARLNRSTDLQRDIRDYKHQHAGTPHVLREGQEAFRERESRVEDALTLLVVSLRNQTPFSQLDGAHRYMVDGDVPSRFDDLRRGPDAVDPAVEQSDGESLATDGGGRNE
jgi:hypothetical protein